MVPGGRAKITGLRRRGGVLLHTALRAGRAEVDGPPPERPAGEQDRGHAGGRPHLLPVKRGAAMDEPTCRGLRRSEVVRSLRQSAASHIEPDPPVFALAATPKGLPSPRGCGTGPAAQAGRAHARRLSRAIYGMRPRDPRLQTCTSAQRRKLEVRSRVTKRHLHCYVCASLAPSSARKGWPFRSGAWGGTAATGGSTGHYTRGEMLEGALLYKGWHLREKAASLTADVVGPRVLVLRRPEQRLGACSRGGPTHCRAAACRYSFPARRAHGFIAAVCCRGWLGPRLSFTGDPRKTRSAGHWGAWKLGGPRAPVLRQSMLVAAPGGCAWP